MIYDVGGGIPNGRKLKALVPGGSSTFLLTQEEAESATMDYDWFAKRGEFLRHRGIARWTLPLWLYVSITGVLVYLMLYHLYPAH